MRVLITGVDAAGRSCVVSEKVVAKSVQAAATDFAGTAVENLYSMAEGPPARPARRGMSLDARGAPGLPRWYVVDFAPAATTPLHHTDSIDFDVVLEGSVDVILEDGPHRLEVGDCIVMTGVDHGWHAGPRGCRSLVLVVGTAPSD